MDRVIKAGRFFFAIAMVVFGIQHFVYSGFVAGLELVPKWIPGHAFWAYLTGAALIASGVSIAIEKQGRLASALLGLAFFLCVLVLNGPRIAAILHDVGERTRAFETLALCGGAWLITGTLPARHAGLQGWDRATEKAAEVGRYFLAISMAIFGLDHFEVAGFIAGLIPSWIPWHWFWVYFTAFGFIATAVSIATKVWAHILATLLGTMFFLWAVLLHAPRVAHALHNGNEWNSAFVAVAMCGCALTAAGVAPMRKTTNERGYVMATLQKANES